MSDPDLLQRYVQGGSPDAFATIVQRHLNLVYSVARRQTGSPSLAEDVAQSVFIELAQQAARIKPGTPLVAWLHVVSRRTAINAARENTRRQLREHTAAELAAMKSPSPAWQAIEPLLDEAVESLDETDRTAILLRFFENKSLREVGAVLGSSDDAAQKRVTRALDQLRAFFLRRGVALTAAGLATDLSAFTIETAPAALATHIAATAPLLSAVAAPATTAAVQQAAFTVLQKSIAAAAAAAVLGVALYETTTYLHQRNELAASQVRAEQHRAALRQLSTDQVTATARLQAARASLAVNSRLSGPTDPEVAAAIEAWLKRLSRLKQLVVERPDLAIPELAVLTEDGWYAVAREAKFNTEEQIRETIRNVHDTARKALASAFSRALTGFADAHQGALPSAVTQLAPWMPPHLPAALFDRYELLQRGAFLSVTSDDWILAERLDVARPHDNRVFVARQENGLDDLTSVSDRQFRFAVRAFAAARAGQLPTGPADVLAYLPTPPTPAAQQGLLARPKTDFAPETLRALLAN